MAGMEIFLPTIGRPYAACSAKTGLQITK